MQRGEKKIIPAIVSFLLCPLGDCDLLASSSDLMQHSQGRIPLQPQLFVLARSRSRNLVLGRGRSNHITGLNRGAASCAAGQVPGLASTCACKFTFANSLGGKAEEQH